MSDAQWQAMLEIHLTVPFRIIRAASAYLRETAKKEAAEQGSAQPRKIINISSTSGTRGSAGQANYAAGKAGVVGLTKTLAREWGRFNIQVNAVAFGWIDTRLTREKEKGVKIRREQLRSPSAFPRRSARFPRLSFLSGGPARRRKRRGPFCFSPRRFPITSPARCSKWREASNGKACGGERW